MSYDLTDFDVTKVPKTAGLAEQKQFSMTPEESWLFEKLIDGVFFPGDDEWPALVYTGHLHEDYQQYASNYGKFAARGGRVTLGRFLGRLWGGLEKVKKRNVRLVPPGEQEERNIERPLFYKIPTLEFCRAAWEKKFGPMEWPVIKDASVNDIAPNTKDKALPF